ncbi:hypothetical protein [Amycolatopsis sp. lyj-109]|uniref:hypothetical protein n=1 Tax=Amycolatopsis sp. lyj-109 TaxID=2789287 RepID=UPI003979F01F
MLATVLSEFPVDVTAAGGVGDAHAVRVPLLKRADRLLQQNLWSALVASAMTASPQPRRGCPPAVPSEFVKSQPTTKAPADWSTGDVWFDVVYAGEEPSRRRANLVRFSPGAQLSAPSPLSDRPG